LKRSLSLSLLIFVILTIFLNSCVPQTAAASETVTPTVTPFTATPEPEPVLWVSTEVPVSIQSVIQSSNALSIVSVQSNADLKLVLATTDNSAGDLGHIEWVYALAAPFPTVTDGVSLDAVKALWLGTVPEDDTCEKLQVSSETKVVFDALWGTASADTVAVVDATSLTTNDFKSLKTWAILPFDALTPRWKVIQVNGLSPLDKPLDVQTYPLKADFVFQSDRSDDVVKQAVSSLLTQVPATNRDESKMTVLMMTGTTALVRAIAYKMEIKGMDYPIEKIKDWFKDADLIHVSNEVSFNEDCPFPNYAQVGLRFCSNPKYLQTLQDLGVNVVELTGNHENDYGSEYLDSTIDTYKELGWYTFGGGKTEDEAKAPVKIEINGNKIAFIGCNPEGPSTDWATDTTAGSAQCDMDYYNKTISELKSEGYVVVATFQQFEVYTYLYGDQIANDFRNAAAAGADIVSGSQSHYAMGFQFEGNSLIHYGPGNFLFDMMTYEGVGDDIRREFLDKHIIYDGKYINTQLYTAYLVDWSQPTPMTADQRADFLTKVFNGSIWSEKNENH
jgi:poly-gamma-glutamate synthesis protein (capsule biosynthesis protein)